MHFFVFPAMLNGGIKCRILRSQNSTNDSHVHTDWWHWPQLHLVSIHQPFAIFLAPFHFHSTLASFLCTPSRVSSKSNPMLLPLQLLPACSLLRRGPSAAADSSHILESVQVKQQQPFLPPAAMAPQIAQRPAQLPQQPRELSPLAAKVKTREMPSKSTRFILSSLNNHQASFLLLVTDERALNDNRNVCVFVWMPDVVFFFFLRGEKIGIKCLLFFFCSKCWRWIDDIQQRVRRVFVHIFFLSDIRSLASLIHSHICYH